MKDRVSTLLNAPCSKLHPRYACDRWHPYLRSWLNWTTSNPTASIFRDSKTSALIVLFVRLSAIPTRLCPWRLPPGRSYTRGSSSAISHVLFRRCPYSSFALITLLSLSLSTQRPCPRTHGRAVRAASADHLDPCRRNRCFSTCHPGPSPCFIPSIESIPGTC